MNRKVALVGALMAVIGILILSGATGLTTVSYPEVGDTAPGGSEGSPTTYVAGSTVPISLRITVYDITDGGFDDYWSAAVTARFSPDRASVQNDTVQLHYVRDVGSRDRVALYEGNWTVPANIAGTTYRVDWTVTGGDLIASKTTYCKISENQPVGTFRLNGRAATSSSDITVGNRTLIMEYVPINYAENIGSVHVEVWHNGEKLADVQLDKGVGSYDAVRDLPEAGIYGLKGYVVTGSGTELNFVDAMVTYDDGSDYIPQDPYTGEGGSVLGASSGIVGFCLLGAGAFVLVLGMRMTPVKKVGRKR